MLHGRETGVVQQQVHGFYGSVASIFEQLVNRRDSPHTRRAYRDDIMAFVGPH